MFDISLEDYLLNLENDLYSNKISFMEYLNLCNMSYYYVVDDNMISYEHSWIYWRMVNKLQNLISNPKTFRNKQKKYVKTKSKLNIMIKNDLLSV